MTRQNFHRVSFLGHQTTLVADRISMQATERKYKHKASDKTCFKHISNQKSWMQMSWFWWLIKTKRILLFSDLSWSNWKEFSYLLGSWLGLEHAWLLFSQLIISFNFMGKAWTGSWLGHCGLEHALLGELRAGRAGFLLSFFAFKVIEEHLELSANIPYSDGCRGSHWFGHWSSCSSPNRLFML